MINQAALDLIKEFEGLSLAAYLCPAGVWTIGYGHTSRAGEPKVTPGMTIGEDRAEAILRRDLRVFEDAVDRAVNRPMTENQRGAFVSLCYNIGAGAFAKSTAVKRFNAGDVHGAAEAMTWWNKAGGKVLRGLVRRREAERALFLSEEVGEDIPVSPTAPIEGREPKPLASSKTVALGGAGTVAAGAAVFSDLMSAAPELAKWAPYILAGVALMVVVNRVMDRRKGIH